MSHPYYHAISSARKFGGHPDDYQWVHDFFDATKAAYADTRHRAVLHHTFGVSLLRDIHGDSLGRYSDGGTVPLDSVGMQHLSEDCGFAPTLQQWLQALPREHWMRDLAAIPHERMSAKRFGGDPLDYYRLHAWMDRGRDEWDDPRAHAVLHSSFGIFLAEQKFGTVLHRSDGRAVPVRLLAEHHVIRTAGFIPTPEKWLANLPIEPWMRRGALPLSKILAPLAEALEANARQETA